MLMMSAPQYAVPPWHDGFAAVNANQSISIYSTISKCLLPKSKWPDPGHQDQAYQQKNDYQRQANLDEILE